MKILRVLGRHPIDRVYSPNGIHEWIPLKDYNPLAAELFRYIRKGSVDQTTFARRLSNKFAKDHGDGVSVAVVSTRRGIFIRITE